MAVEPMVFVLAGVALVLLAALAIGWSRRRSAAPSAERPFFDREDADQEDATAGPSEAEPESAAASNGGRRRPVEAEAGALVGATTAAPTADLRTAGSLAERSAPTSSKSTTSERPGTVRFWRLFDGDADIGEGAGPVCSAVDGVTIDGVIDLVTMDFEHRGFVVRPQSPERIRAHRGPVVLQATFRSVHTDLTRKGGVYDGTAQPFVLVEIEVPPKDPPTPVTPTIGLN